MPPIHPGGISDFGFRIYRRGEAIGLIEAGCPRLVGRPEFSRHGEPGGSRHAGREQHRRHTTISLESTIKTLLPLGKARRARPDVAFRGRVGGGWGRGK